MLEGCLMSLLSICTDACNYIPEAAPSSIVGNTSNEAAILLLALANAAGNALAKRTRWVAMNREYNFQTESSGPYDGTVFNVADQATIILAVPVPGIQTTGWTVYGTNLRTNSIVVDLLAIPGGYSYKANLAATEDASAAGQFYFSRTDYDLPSDFDRDIDGTFWDRTNYWQMRGALSPQDWQAYRSSLFSQATIQRRWRFRNSDWLSSSTGTPSTNVLSIDPQPLSAGANLVFEYVSNGWCANASTGARQSQWLADTDYGVLDEYLLGLSVKWRLLRRRGLSYSEELDEYEREVDKAVARDGGAATLNMTPNRGTWLVGPWTVQDGNFPAGPVS
jgi:hypothetical protein